VNTDVKAFVDLFTDPKDTTPAVSGVMVYIASPDKKLNKNYLGPASLEEMADQIVRAKGPSGPNRDYIFQLELALLQIGTLLSGSSKSSTQNFVILLYFLLSPSTLLSSSEVSFIPVGCEDKHIIDLANTVRKLLSERESNS
ncbi:Gamma-glutamylcyclotransferase, partial [Thalictrum thalictroides]